jgi:hypothetical protein
MTDHTELALLRQDMEEMKKDMKDLKGEVKELLEAWNTATGILKIMKWLAMFGAAIAAIVGVYKGYK